MVTAEDSLQRRSLELRPGFMANVLCRLEKFGSKSICVAWMLMSYLQDKSKDQLRR